jgi:hypothetical protein
MRSNKLGLEQRDEVKRSGGIRTLCWWFRKRDKTENKGQRKETGQETKEGRKKERHTYLGQQCEVKMWKDGGNILPQPR